MNFIFNKFVNRLGQTCAMCRHARPIAELIRAVGEAMYVIKRIY